MGPKAAVTQATYPLFSGKAVASSAVIRASGIDHIRGNRMKPRIDSRGPAALTASCMGMAMAWARWRVRLIFPS